MSLTLQLLTLIAAAVGCWLLVNLEILIMATQAEIAQGLKAVTAQLNKAKAEIVAKVAALEQAIGDAGSSTPEVDQALADLKGAAQSLDDLNPDAPVDVPTP
jgi:hypothetical protein